MPGKYQAYPEYNDSGVEWLGVTPTHWGAKQIKFLCTYNDEVLTDSISDEYKIEYVDIGSVSATEGITKTESMFFGKAPSRARRIVRNGDVIISTVRTYLEAIAPIDNPPENLIVSTGFAVIRPNKLLYKGYAGYCLRANGFIKEVVARSVGISYPAINASDLVNIKAPEPAYDEQKNIADFLDHETAKIDTLIDKQEHLVKLLKEKRQAVISHAVTKGLNPNASMRDSGIEWLGEVPVHWGLGYSKWMFEERKQKALKTDEMLTASQKYGVIPQKEFMKLEQQKVVQVQKGHDILKHVEDGDFVISMRSFQGGIEFCAFHGAVSSAYVPLIPKNEICAQYFKFLFKSNQYIQALQSTTNLVRDGQALRYSNFIQILLPVAPLDEQKDIAKFLMLEVGKIDRLVATAEVGIELMKERRTTLISETVTGKIDVRNWVSPEPLNSNNKEVTA